MIAGAHYRKTIVRLADPDPKHIETFYPVGIHGVAFNGRVVIEGHSYT